MPEEARARRAHHLATNRSPGYWAFGGYNAAMLPAVGHHTVSSRMLGHRTKREDPHINTFIQGVKEWSHGAGPGRMRSGEHTPGLAELAATVQHAPPSHVPIYRGATLEEHHKTPGAIIDDNYSSYTTRERVARRFATRKPGKKAAQWGTGGHSRAGTPSVIVSPAGTHSLHISPAARQFGIGMAEHLRHGKSQVSHVEHKNGVDYVHVLPIENGKTVSLAELGERAKNAPRPVNTKAAVKSGTKTPKVAAGVAAGSLATLGAGAAYQHQQKKGQLPWQQTNRQKSQRRQIRQQQRTPMGQSRTPLSMVGRPNMNRVPQPIGPNAA